MKNLINIIFVLIFIITITFAGCQKDQPTNKVQDNSKIFTVAIDAGHGGRDPGAVGPNKLLEKDVTLSIAKRVAATLEEDGFNAILTRSVDEFVSLEDRIELTK
ncbi:MAG: N-acetylmuramoyl-L-alanine amidase, partial [Bacteroidales bacterium]|nr:N-acetylmuramoyl-L-alanine amidase [Bacteroidales bacterium]